MSRQVVPCIACGKELEDREPRVRVIEIRFEGTQKAQAQFHKRCWEKARNAIVSLQEKGLFK